MTHQFGEEFYKRAIEQEGADYNVYGDWQRNYAKMVIAISDIIETASNDQNSLILDVGCACGVTLRAFKETKVFGRVLGLDISEYMINLGKTTHGFSDDELIVHDLTQEPIPIEDNSVTFLHCTHTLEHISEDTLQDVIEEFERVLKPEGMGFIIIPAIKPGNTKVEVSREKTHVIIETVTWWRNRFAKSFSIDNDIRKEFKKSPFSPSNDETTFYDHYNKGWTIFGLRKEK